MHFPTFSFNTSEFIFCICEHAFMSAWNSFSFPLSPPYHMSLAFFLSLSFFFFLFKSQVFSTPENFLSSSFLHRYCRRINKLKPHHFTLSVWVLMLWQRKVKTSMNSNMFYINCVNTIINDELCSLFRTCNVAFS